MTCTHSNVEMPGGAHNEAIDATVHLDIYEVPRNPTQDIGIGKIENCRPRTQAIKYSEVASYVCYFE